MPRVIFTADFNWHVPGKPAVTVAFKAGSEYPVTRRCAADAIAAGKARAAVPVEENSDASR